METSACADFLPTNEFVGLYHLSHSAYLFLLKHAIEEFWPFYALAEDGFAGEGVVDDSEEMLIVFPSCLL